MRFFALPLLASCSQAMTASFTKSLVADAMGVSAAKIDYEFSMTATTLITSVDFTVSVTEALKTDANA